jgi:hypothetical protein
MKEHVTDVGLLSIFVGELEGEEEFYKMILHMGECQVCRERAWQLVSSGDPPIMAVRKLTSGLIENIETLLSDTRAKIGKLMGYAVKAASLLPAEESITGAKINLAPFDDLDHLKSCPVCRGKIRACAEALKAVKNDAQPNDPMLPGLMRVETYLLHQLEQSRPSPEELKNQSRSTPDPKTCPTVKEQAENPVGKEAINRIKDVIGKVAP